jgi:hypothetical protein
MVDLIDDDGGMVEAFKEVLVAIFKRFDTDGDGFLNKEELIAYSKSANADGRAFDDDELGQIAEFFAMPLDLEGWLDMYHTQTGADEARRPICCPCVLMNRCYFWFCRRRRGMTLDNSGTGMTLHCPRVLRKRGRSRPRRARTKDGHHHTPCQPVHERQTMAVKTINSSSMAAVGIVLRRSGGVEITVIVLR